MIFIQAHTEEDDLLLVEHDGAHLSYNTHYGHRGSQEEEVLDVNLCNSLEICVKVVIATYSTVS